MSESSVPSARRVQTRDRLMRSALGVFAEKGILGATVEEICEAAGFTRGAFYSNFESKDDLCIALLTVQKRRLLSGVMSGIATESGDLIDQRRLSIDVVLNKIMDNFYADRLPARMMIMFHAEIGLYAMRNEAVRPAYRSYSAAWAETFENLLTQSLRASHRRLSIPIEQALDQLAAMFVHIGIRALIHQAPELGREMMGRGLRTTIEMMTEPVSDDAELRETESGRAVFPRV